MTPEPAARNENASSTSNTLLAAATPLLNAIAQIRQAATHDDPAGLRQQLIEAMRHFEDRCKQAGIPFEMIIGARYCLCSMLDEAAAQTPWGTRGIWSGNGLLATFHNEGWGGEKFFQLLSRISQTPQQHLWLLELIDYGLLLGYEGRYRSMTNGRQQRDMIRQRLAQLIAETRNTAASSLAEQVSVRPVKNRMWRPPVPLWACMTIAALIAALIYSGLNWHLGKAATPLLQSIYQMPLPQISTTNHASKTQSLLNLQQRLNDVIAAGQIEVSDGAFGSKIILPADRLFSQNTTKLNAMGRALVLRIAAAMNDVNGTVIISAYTDNHAPPGDHYASNYEYSLAQAQAVAALLRQQLAIGHNIKAEGRGDSTTLLPNDSHENRMRNRRIEITLFATPEPVSPLNKGAQ